MSRHEQLVSVASHVTDLLKGQFTPKSGDPLGLHLLILSTHTWGNVCIFYSWGELPLLFFYYIVHDRVFWKTLWDLIPPPPTHTSAIPVDSVLITLMTATPDCCYFVWKRIECFFPLPTRDLHVLGFSRRWSQRRSQILWHLSSRQVFKSWKVQGARFTFVLTKPAPTPSFYCLSVGRTGHSHFLCSCKNGSWKKWDLADRVVIQLCGWSLPSDVMTFLKIQSMTFWGSVTPSGILLRALPQRERGTINGAS